MIPEEEEAVDDLEWKILNEDEQTEPLTKRVRNKNIHDFLKNNGSPSKDGSATRFY